MINHLKSKYNLNEVVIYIFDVIKEIWIKKENKQSIIIFL